MQITELALPEVKLITLKKFDDPRGFFSERYREDLFKEASLPTNFVQDNFSRSDYRVLRGLHFQFDRPQGKLVTCLHGQILDVVMDARFGSPRYGQHVTIELDCRKPQWVWVPPGFAHGICIISKQPADLYYKVTEYYNPKGEAGIIWDDPKLRINWPDLQPLLSEKDTKLQSFEEYSEHPKFIYQ